MARPIALGGSARRSAWFAAHPAVCAAACLGLTSAACTDRADEGPAGFGAGAILCTYAYRESNEVMPGQDGDEPELQFEERELLVGPNEQASELLGQILLSAEYTPSEFEGNSFQLRASSGDDSLFSLLFQFVGALPINQFAGGHGFTGLLYFSHPTAGGDYQAFCQSVY